MRAAQADGVALARAALARGEWATARAAFEAALAGGESPGTLEGLARACWWLEDLDACAEARERAYRLYREQGDARGSARVACQIAREAALRRGDMAALNGWTERARRLLSEVEVSPEHAFLAMHESNCAFLFTNDPATARAKAVEAVELAQRFGLIDVEMLARAVWGATLVSEGDVAGGMRLLDEATAAATGGEMHDVELIAATGCTMIVGCERVRDFERAGQWCTRMMEFCRRTGLGGLFAVCRTHYAIVLTERGDWAEAERELQGAAEQLALHRGLVGDTLASLGELRRRQGRLDEATALFDRVAFHPQAQIGHAALALDRGDPGTAARWAERFLRQVAPEDRMLRARGWELLARARAALDDLDGARAAADEVASVAEATANPALAAAASATRGVVEARSGDQRAARELLEDAVDRLAAAGLPYAAAEARLALAGVLRQEGSADEAAREARLAAEAFARLGAMRPAPEPPSSAHAGLSRREMEVLRLVAEGLSDRDIAERLVISPHTVHRHVSNLLTKLGVTSRTAAAAAASRLHLL
ncbi:MAG TPA: LuxR C-terminal-related transcriptional regulator [Actinomycetota bacterium]|nr:LuxR C-terminal-related transcriptional regulator [Actinomycetota bacterium]